MVSSSTVSVSKGVFAFKKSKSKKHEPQTYDYWPGDSQEERETTYYNYRKCLNTVKDITDNLQKKTHEKVFSELIHFFQNAHEQSSQTLGEFMDIPTACLLTGVNMPDHTAIFGNIEDMIYHKVTAHVARLQSQECPSVRSAIFKMISQLIKRQDMYLDLMEEETGPSVKRAQCTMAVLNSWYQDQITRENQCSPTKAWSSPRKRQSSPQKSDCSPRKKMKVEMKVEPGKRQPVVVIFEDVESFPAHVLQDVILICREHIKNIPFVFLFGVATTSSAIHHMLSQEASSCLAMETFQAQPSTYFLSEVIDKVLMSPDVPFRLGGRTFKLLLDVFLYHDLSVENFIRAFQVCLIEHFSNNPASYLCCTAYGRKKAIKSMDSAQLDGFRKLASFRTYVESCPLQDQAALLIKEKETKETILKLLEDLESFYMRFCVLVKIVNIFTGTLPKSPLGRQVREAFATCLSRSLVKTEEYEEVQKMMKHLSKEELMPLLHKAIKLLDETECDDEVLKELRTKLSTFVSQLDNLDKLPQVEETPSESSSPAAFQVKDRFELKEKLKELATKSKKTNPYDTVRSGLLSLLDSVFREHLVPPSKKPLNEVLFFDSSTVIKRQLLGMARPAVTTALANPHHYLQCDCCALEEPSNIVTTLPDVSVAYKLHLECGRLINLFDWLQAFVSVIDPETETSSKKINKTYQARFVQALLELQFLGFVKQTRRKTDHVARLTWGGC